MGLLSDLLLFPVTGPVRGLLFVVEQLKEQVDEEVAGESSRIEEELLDLGLRYELGELSEQAYAAQEDALLARLNDLRQQQDDWVDTTADGWAETTESEFEQDEYAIADGDATDQA